MRAVDLRFSLLFACVAALGLACHAGQRAAEKLIDPELRARGVLVERQGPRRDLALGRYRVEALELLDEAFDGTGPLAPDESGRTRPTQQQRLRFTLAGGGRPWRVECVGQRRQPPDHDLAALADEAREEVAVRCQLAGGEQRWLLRIDGSLGANMLGALHELDGAGRSKVVELIMWHELWNLTRRRLPASLVVIRGAGGTEGALILDAPERAWLDPDLDEPQRELLLAGMLGLRLLPLGFAA